ncbi:META domain-containing protein [Halomonas huangheensis]|uniref:DUF306 domain-containing protein n=1 Tax=Halomonas huangheensis TaxID=1178482 RepID=W1NAZ3_9GAMM|nr:META domain-containing protein [Halomonas huangheensis]ALM53746.1 hypothetical protein AR456_16795 [Halomonas huangheensis]ERL52336.1 hypothetical protein BJB45_10235 [Halomonas huangheensis]
MTLLRIRQLFSLAALTLVLSACSSQPSPQVDGSDSSGGVSGPVVGKRWNLLLVGTDEKLSMPSTPWFQIDGSGKVSGSDGCNQLTGTVALGDSHRIEFSDLATTRRACPQSDDAQRVRDMLDDAYRYLIDHDRLVFFGPNSLVLGGFRLAK